MTFVALDIAVLAPRARYSFATAQKSTQKRPPRITCPEKKHSGTRRASEVGGILLVTFLLLLTESNSPAGRDPRCQTQALPINNTQPKQIQTQKKAPNHRGFFIKHQTRSFPRQSSQQVKQMYKDIENAQIHANRRKYIVRLLTTNNCAGIIKNKSTHYQDYC